MSNVTTVASVQDAVELAQAFKAEGRYNWFRGQVRDWPPVSSLGRLQLSGDGAAVERAMTRYRLFCKWLGESPTLKHLLNNEHTHQLFAVAQHYGIPTHYIDFTTEPAVAGFFASDTKTPSTDGMSCIYCLNTEDLTSLAEMLRTTGLRNGMSIETVEVDVTNLWRLQAQHGVFLFSDYNWHVDYPMDRILFPYSGYPSYPPRSHVYPEHKSALEILLDQYFDIERRHFGHQQMREVVASIKKKGGHASLTHMNDFVGGFCAEAFVDPDGVTPLPSWSRSRNPEWHTYPDERFHDIDGYIKRIRLNAVDRPSLERAIAFGVKQILDAEPQTRRKLVEWTIEGATGDLPTERLGALFRDAWNGMRRLPFSNAQIAAAFSVIAGLASVGFGAGPQPEDDSQRFSMVRGNGFRVEFAYADRSSSRGYATEEAIRRAVRGDLKALVAPKHHHQIEEVRTTFRLIRNPVLLFEFDAFADIFAWDLIPTQVVLGRNPILFNPAAITTFGLP